MNKITLCVRNNLFDPPERISFHTDLELVSYLGPFHAIRIKKVFVRLNKQFGNKI